MCSDSRAFVSGFALERVSWKALLRRQLGKLIRLLAVVYLVVPYYISMKTLYDVILEPHADRSPKTSYKAMPFVSGRSKQQTEFTPETQDGMAWIGYPPVHRVESGNSEGLRSISLRNA